jgi:hypothetical protein
MKMGIRDSLIDKNKTREVRQLRDKKGDKTGTRGKTANHSQGGRCPVYRRNSPHKTLTTFIECGVISNDIDKTLSLVWV